MKPFDEDCFHKYYAPGKMPKYGAIRRPSELQVNAVLRATGHDFLILPALRVFLQIKCNAQNLSGWGWNEIMTALSYYQKSENERSQREMKQQMEREKEQKVQWEREKRLREQVLQQKLSEQDRKAKSEGSEQESENNSKVIEANSAKTTAIKTALSGTDFEFLPGQIFYNGCDLNIRSRLKREVFETLHESIGRVVSIEVQRKKATKAIHYISELNKLFKAENMPFHIHTITGEGYKLERS